MVQTNDNNIRKLGVTRNVLISRIESRKRTLNNGDYGRISNSLISEDIQCPNFEKYQSLTTHYDKVYDICWSSDSTKLLSTSADKCGILQDICNQSILCTYNLCSSLSLSCDLSPDSTVCAFTNEHKQIIIAPVIKDEMITLTDPSLTRLNGHNRYILDLHFLNSDQLISGAADGFIKHWDLNNSSEINSFGPHQGAVLSIASRKWSSTLLSTSTDRTARQFDLRSNQCTMVYPLPVHGNEIVWFPNGYAFAIAGDDGKIRLGDVRAKQLLTTFSLPEQIECNCLKSLSFSKSGRILFSSGTIRNGPSAIFVIDTAKQIHLDTLLGEAVISRVKVAPGGQFFASACWDSIITVWK
eukprot:TRINITY_DN9470_c0_g1_i1.p1 TRINITY_DN9470_c0_g1~~TRINITY_DN9470_c0_g1_i1.p1  ORF type:complete len:355 (-),score=55.72 TRINITY_DN9470_c0_g1_i1:157-1221(-)